MSKIKEILKFNQENVKSYIYWGIHTSEKSLFQKILYKILWLLSMIYACISRIRYYLYLVHLLPRQKLICPVISVGNITVGGTGKTPCVKYLVEKLRLKGYKIAILTRGYKRPLKDESTGKSESSEITDITVVSDFNAIRTDWKTAGDEPYLLAKSLPGVAVLVGSKRKKSYQYAIKKMGANLIILDDGFSHFPMRRTIDLVLIDTTNPFGFGYCIPRGLLREPVSGLSRAQGIILTRAEPNQDYSKLLFEIQKYAPGVPVFKSNFNILGLTNIQTGEVIIPMGMGGNRIMAVSGIGNPDSFERNLKSLNLDIRQHIIYPDHYIYSRVDIDIIRNYILAESIDWVITTTKDAVKIKPLLNDSDLKWYNMEIDFEMNFESQFWKFIEDKLSSK